MILTIILLRIWFLGAIIFTLNSVSHALFSLDTTQKAMKDVAKAICFSACWPIAVLSPEGRRVLLGYFGRL